MKIKLESTLDEFEMSVNTILNEATAEAGKLGRKNLDKDNRFVIMVNAGSKVQILIFHR